MQLQRSGNPAVTQGLIFGAIIAVLGIINIVLTYFASISFFSFVVIVVGLALYVFAAFRASAVTGKLGTGVIAGLIAGAFSALVSGIVTIALALAFTSTFTAVAQKSADAITKATGQASQHITDSQTITNAITAAALSIVGAAIFGALFGLIGGAIGRGRAPKPEPQMYQDSMYQGLPQNMPPQQ